MRGRARETELRNTGEWMKREVKRGTRILGIKGGRRQQEKTSGERRRQELKGGEERRMRESK